MMFIEFSKTPELPSGRFGATVSPCTLYDYYVQREAEKEVEEKVKEERNAEEREPATETTDGKKVTNAHQPSWTSL